MTSQHAYDALADDVAALGVKKSSMFGRAVLKRGRRPLCALTDDGVAFRLADGAPIERAMALAGAHVFEVGTPPRTKRMSNWIVVPTAFHEQYVDLLHDSMRYVSEME